MREYPAGHGAPTFVLAHGAGAGHDHPWMQRVGNGLASRGVRVVTFNFPYRDAGRNPPDKGPVLEEAFRTIWMRVAETASGPMFAGGKSMGGRIASQVAAQKRFVPAPAGLVFFGYPLHPPAKPAQRRDRHLPNVAVPMLFVQGTRDLFGSPDEMHALVASLPTATLHIVDGGDHSLAQTKKADKDGQGFERVLDVAAAWILERTKVDA